MHLVDIRLTAGQLTSLARIASTDTPPYGWANASAKKALVLKGLVDHTKTGYHISERGRALLNMFRHAANGEQ